MIGSDAPAGRGISRESSGFMRRVIAWPCAVRNAHGSCPDGEVWVKRGPGEEIRVRTRLWPRSASGGTDPRTKSGDGHDAEEDQFCACGTGIRFGAITRTVFFWP